MALPRGPLNLLSLGYTPYRERNLSIVTVTSKSAERWVGEISPFHSGALRVFHAPANKHLTLQNGINRERKFGGIGFQ